MIWRERTVKERKRTEEEGEKSEKIKKEGEERVVAPGVTVEKAAEEPE